MSLHRRARVQGPALGAICTRSRVDSTVPACRQDEGRHTQKSPAHRRGSRDPGDLASDLYSAWCGVIHITAPGGSTPMPENEQQTESTEQETTEVEATTDATTDSDDTSENDSDAGEQVQETDKSDTEEFDAKRAKEKIHSANNEAANLRKRLKALESKNKELEPLAKKARE